MRVPLLIGLCAACHHLKPVHSTKGSLFVMCGYAKIDTRFEKYPPLPVLRCSAFQPRQPAPASETTSD